MRSLNRIATHWRDIQETVHNAHCTMHSCTVFTVQYPVWLEGYSGYCTYPATKRGEASQMLIFFLNWWWCDQLTILLIKLHAILIPTMSVKELNSVITTLWTMNCHYSDDDDNDDDDDGDEIKVLCQVEVTSVSLFFINSCTLARLPRAGLSVRWWWWRWRWWVMS